MPPVEPTGIARGAVLACLIAVETMDDALLAKTVVVPDMLRFAKQGYETLVLYPYASLTAERAGAKQALAVIRALRHAVQSAIPQSLCIKFAPFGWAKSLRMEVDQNSPTCLQHLGDYTGAPSLQGIAKSVTIDRQVVELTRNGDDASAKLAGDLLVHETGGECKGIVTASDAWHGLYYLSPTSINHRGQPIFIDAGHHFKQRLEKCITNHTRAHFSRIHEMSSPAIFSTRDPLIMGHVSKFPAGQFRIVSGPRAYMLRYATCPQAIKIAENTRLTNANMPYRIYEMAACYRMQRGGVVKNLLRGTTFTMPDMHVFCDDQIQSIITEFSNCLRCHLSLLVKLELAKKCVPHIQIDARFNRETPEFLPAIQGVFASHGYAHVLMGQWPEGSNCYYTVKVELQFKGREFYQLATVQLDMSDAHRARLTATRNVNGCIETYKPMICHSAPGSVERLMAAMLDSGYLGPIRPYSMYIIAVGPDEIRSDVAKIFTGCGVVIDARSHDLRRKMRVYWSTAAHRHPCHAVVGAKELKSGVLLVSKGGQMVKKVKIKELLAQALEYGPIPNMHA